MNSHVKLETLHESFWKEPDRHALLKESGKDLIHYSIYTVEPQFTMLLCDDLDYSLALADMMIKHGVKVFSNFDDLYQNARLRASNLST